MGSFVAGRTYLVIQVKRELYHTELRSRFMV